MSFPTRSPHLRPPALAILIPLALATVVSGEDWPQQLGPDRNGVVDGRGLASSWPGGTLPVLWQANAGFGAAPVVVAGGRVYAIGLFKPGTTPAGTASINSAPTLADIEKGTFPAGDLPGTPDRVTRSDYPLGYRGPLYVLCLEAAHGKTIWATRLTDDGLAFKTNKHSSTAWELASPLIADGRVYFHTHTGRVYCLNTADGKPVWEVNLFEHRMSTWYGGQQGNSCGPLSHGDNIIVGYEAGADRGGSESEIGYLVVAAFDAASGAERWVTKAPIGGLNVRSARLGFAKLGGLPTVLGSCGGGTIGLDPSSGKVLWSFDLASANPNTMNRVPSSYRSQPKLISDYNRDAMRSPYPGYAPLAWRNHVIDAACVGHNSLNSALWCLTVEGGRATCAWQTSAFVPQSASLKSHMVVRDGKLYGFDSFFPRFATQYSVTRPYRGATIGEFQCHDILSGERLWSTDAFHPEPPGPARRARTHRITCSFLQETI